MTSAGHKHSHLGVIGLLNKTGTLLESLMENQGLTLIKTNLHTCLFYILLIYTNLPC